MRAMVLDSDMVGAERARADSENHREPACPVANGPAMVVTAEVVMNVAEPGPSDHRDYNDYSAWHILFWISSYYEHMLHDIPSLSTYPLFCNKME